ncbi:DUF2007 domain-containing protein [Ancylobacter sp. 6x-1]|uniref:DUF2007 domain-containing protein n=1 Tax=Ancylobacter crimeensis TaxID=2579147 RepID=A0ABT0DFQ6_9HYPH|nr:DUF2007 domain-containing protein [Ancylobacter crimeensis]MCK0198790.1 DUF2007 domain-containing protein [Ancylobacter crimeensis]
MLELLRTNDLVLLSAVESLLTAADIPHHVLDGHMSALEGSLGFLPRRLIVPEEDGLRARRLLTEAGFSNVLVS